MSTFKHLAKNKEGTALLEYGMLAGLIPIVCIAVMRLLGNTANDLFTGINAAFTAAGLAP